MREVISTQDVKLLLDLIEKISVRFVLDQSSLLASVVDLLDIDLYLFHRGINLGIF